MLAVMMAILEKANLMNINILSMLSYCAAL